MKVTEVYELYKSNAEIKEYIDKYCKTNHISLHEAVLHKIVHEYISYYLEAGKGKCETPNQVTKTTTNIACGVGES